MHCLSVHSWTFTPQSSSRVFCWGHITVLDLWVEMYKEEYPWGIFFNFLFSKLQIRGKLQKKKKHSPGNFCSNWQNKAHPSVSRGLPRWLNGKESACQYKRSELNPWVRKNPWSRKWQPTPVSLLGNFMERSLEGCSLQGHIELDMAEQLSTYTRTCLKVS